MRWTLRRIRCVAVYMLSVRRSSRFSPSVRPLRNTPSEFIRSNISLEPEGNDTVGSGHRGDEVSGQRIDLGRIGTPQDRVGDQTTGAPESTEDDQRPACRHRQVGLLEDTRRETGPRGSRSEIATDHDAHVGTGGHVATHLGEIADHPIDVGLRTRPTPGARGAPASPTTRVRASTGSRPRS